MRFPVLVLIALLGLAAPFASAAPASGLSFVQATVVTSDASARTLSFVDPSGRSRSHPVTGAAVARASRLRAGDEVIVVLSGASPVVQDIRVSHAVPVAPSSTDGTAEATAGLATEESQWTVVPAHELRPTWPNPYSRYYKGSKPAKRR
jgi:hypothetical protein